MEERKYSRKFMRISSDQPLFGSASIVQIEERRVYSGSARVRILNISPGGLKFVSSLRLPADSKVLLEICLNLDGYDYCLRGNIVYCSSTEVSEYEYGFRFPEPDGNLRSALKKLFSRLYIMSNRHIVILRIK